MNLLKTAGRLALIVLVVPVAFVGAMAFTIDEITEDLIELMHDAYKALGGE
jgi:hypothetical protein